MQVVPNQADITGEVLQWESTGDVIGYGLATISIKSAENIEGFANLIAQHVGTLLKIYVPVDKKADSGEVHLRVRMAGPGRFFAS